MQNRGDIAVISHRIKLTHWTQICSKNLDTQIVDDMEDSQSSASASSNMVTTPPPLTPCRRPTPGKRMHYGQNKRDAIWEKLLKIIEKPEKEPDEDEIFCQNLATSLRKIQDPQRKEYTKLKLQQTMYDCMYGSQPNVGLAHLNKFLCLCHSINKATIIV